MILPKAKSSAAQPKTIVLADGQTFTVLVSRPNFQQRFNDEGRELKAYAGTGGPDAWAEYRLGRIRDTVVDWEDMTNEKGQAVPYTFARLLALFEACPEIVPQFKAIANEAFRPLVDPSLTSDEPRANSGAADESATAPSPTTSEPTSNSDASADSPAPPESPSES